MSPSRAAPRQCSTSTVRIVDAIPIDAYTVALAFVTVALSILLIAELRTGRLCARCTSTNALLVYTLISLTHLLGTHWWHSAAAVDKDDVGDMEAGPSPAAADRPDGVRVAVASRS